MTTREQDEVSEEVRTEVKKDLRRFARVNNAQLVARHVDQQAFDKCMISMYGQYENNIGKNKVYDDIEKNRGRYGSGYHPAEINLATPFEKIFFENMGRGYQGSAPDKIGAEWVCPGCGLKFAMSQKLAPETCPRCGRLTARGILNKDNPSWWKR